MEFVVPTANHRATSSTNNNTILFNGNVPLPICLMNVMKSSRSPLECKFSTMSGIRYLNSSLQSFSKASWSRPLCIFFGLSYSGLWINFCFPVTVFWFDGVVHSFFGMTVYCGCFWCWVCLWYWSAGVWRVNGEWPSLWWGLRILSTNVTPLWGQC